MVRRVLVIGLGQVGKAVYELLLESRAYSVFGIDMDEAKSVNLVEEIPVPLDFLHVCYPYGPNFVDVTTSYMQRFKPRCTIIHSTVAPGTTRRIYEETGMPIAYSPVRGIHPHMKQHLKFWPKWVSMLPQDMVKHVNEHLISIGLSVRVASRPETLELAKLIETVYRALMITFWQEAHRVALHFNADIAKVAEFIAEVHKVLKDRPVFYPGYISGHCLIPNTAILHSIHPSPLWEFILQSNERRLKEQSDVRIAKDIERVKEIWRELVPKWYFEGNAITSR